MPRWLPRMFRCGLALCLLASSARAEEADAVTRDAARSLGLSGVDAYQAGNYAVASDRLEKAYALINVPSLGLWSARALAKRNLLVEAANRYFEVAGLQVPQGDAAVQRQAQVDAQLELEQLRPQIPRLSIRLTGAEASEVTLAIDGQAAPSSLIGKPRLVNPGAHRIEATLSAKQKTATVQLLPGQEAVVELDFSPSAKAPATVEGAKPTSTRRTLGWVGVGAGGVGIALGSLMGALALGKHASIKDSGVCSGAHCPAEAQSDVNRLNMFRTVSTVGFIAGGALAATGVVLVLTAPSNEQQLAATVSGNGVTLVGRF
jgi:hypothetical protein